VTILCLFCLLTDLYIFRHLK